jgi:hypothetical protein
MKSDEYHYINRLDKLEDDLIELFRTDYEMYKKIIANVG